MPFFNLFDQLEVSPKTFQFGIAGGFIVYVIYGILDPYMLPQTYMFAWSIRIVLGIILIIPFILSFFKRYEKNLGFITVFLILLAQLGVYSMILNSRPEEMGHDNYYLGMVLVILWAAFILRINFKLVLLLTLLSILLYIIHIYLDFHVLDEQMKGRYFTVFFNNSLFFISMSFLAVVGSFLLDDYHQKLIKEKIGLEQALENSKEGDRIKTSFLNTMSHEIRTPLNGIIGFSDILINDDHIEDRNEIYGIINKQGYQLLNILTTILEFSQLQKEDDLGEKNEMELSTLLEHLQSAFSNYIHQYQMKNALLSMEIASDIKESILYLHYEKFLSVINAILENSVKFGNNSPVILQMNRIQDHDLLISITDHGIGLAEKEGHIVFQDFRQMDSGHDRKYDGIGMGLAISNKIIEFMHGSIWYKKNKGSGTTFYIHLPECL